MLFLLSVLAFAEGGGADSLSGGAGWVGAGLLGVVLSWLLFHHLPSKDKQLEKYITDHNTQVESIHEKSAVERKEQTAAFQAALTQVLDRSARDSERTTNALGEEMRTLRATLATLCAAVNSLAAKADHE